MTRHNLSEAIEIVRTAAESRKQELLQSGASPLTEEGLAEIHALMGLLDAVQVLQRHNRLRGHS